VIASPSAGGTYIHLSHPLHDLRPLRASFSEPPHVHLGVRAETLDLDVRRVERLCKSCPPPTVVGAGDHLKQHAASLKQVPTSDRIEKVRSAPLCPSGMTHAQTTSGRIAEPLTAASDDREELFSRPVSGEDDSVKVRTQLGAERALARTRETRNQYQHQSLPAARLLNRLEPPDRARLFIATMVAHDPAHDLLDAAEHHISSSDSPTFVSHQGRGQT
jgi:hypothetical protein